MLSNAIKLIDESLSSHTILVSDAIIALSKLVNKIASDDALSPSETVYFIDAAGSLNKELLGYEHPDWNLESPYRKCDAEIVRKVTDGESSSYKFLSTECFVAVWGAQQIEAHLSEVMNMGVFTTGDDELIVNEVNALSKTNYVLYTESGISSDLWLRFSIMEMVRIYFEIKAVMGEMCRVLVEILENRVAIFNADPAHADLAQADPLHAVPMHVEPAHTTMEAANAQYQESPFASNGTLDFTAGSGKV
ncbi:MAG: hypothetical protein JST89_09930 [Cyanobacteria bacterium SZAS-4]|nr:hypothetical protein [Cyanobacteria bacterium SZAS-4]